MKNSIHKGLTRTNPRVELVDRPSYGVYQGRQGRGLVSSQAGTESGTWTTAGEASQAHCWHPAWRTQWLAITALAALIGLSPVVPVTLLLAVPLGLVILYRHYVWCFRVYDGQIESRNGVIARRSWSIRVRDLRGIGLRQSFWQRLFLIGSVEFSSAASAGVEVAFHGLSNPASVKRLVQRLEGLAV